MERCRPTSPSGDLDSPEQIAEMVRRFYEDVARDNLLGPVFNDIAQVDWSEHLPKLTAFWCRALLFRAHALIHERQPFTPAHFQRWLDLFFTTVQSGWVGPRVDAACSLAANVARVHSQQLLARSLSIEVELRTDP
jgi:hemoglobin